MKKLKILAAALTLVSASASAEIVVGDWKEAGDNLILLDTNTGAEWINPIYTDKYSVNTLMPEIESGGIFEGFRIINSADVESFMGSYYGGLEGFYSEYREDYSSDYYQISENGYSTQASTLYEQTVSLLSLIDGGSSTSTSSYYSKQLKTITYLNENYTGDNSAFEVISASLMVDLQYDGRTGSKDRAVVVINSSNYGGSTLGSAVIVDGFTTYSSTNDANYNSLKLAGLNAVDATNVSTPINPLPALMSLSAFALGFRLRNKKS